MRMRIAFGIPLAHQLIDQLTGRLLGDAEMFGNLTHRGPTRGHPCEGEAVGRTQVAESGSDDPRMDGIGDLGGGREQKERQVLGGCGHRGILALDRKVNKLDYMDKLLDQRENPVPVIRAAEAVVHEMHNARFTAMVRPTTGSAELCVWQVEVAPGNAGVPHRIHREEAFVLLNGAASLTIDGVESPLQPGDSAVALAGSIIKLSNLSETPATLLVTTSVGFTGELLDGTVVNPPWAN